MVCKICHTFNNILVCNGCNDFVCNSNCCQMTFPHYNDQLFIVCNICSNSVIAKLKELPNRQSIHKSLINLKRKIKNSHMRTKKTKTHS